ncbi:MAG: sugar phosphate isomerase/epimerase [Clostridia bacterium]|nr:sugar phosphate isomerase/epimerase [Clostridia bacterium]
MRIGLSLPAKTFMPEETKGIDADFNPFESLVYGYNTAIKIGYDYIEAAVGVINDLTEEEMEKLCGMIDEKRFSLEICNCFIPSDIPVFGTDDKKMREFAESSMKRMSLLNVRKVVFGSGAARMVPCDVSASDADKKLCDFLKMCGEVGERYGITTVLEPLNSTETNIINTLSEGACAVMAANCANVSLLADVFHMSVEGEDVADVKKFDNLISHFHVSEAPGRVFPGKFGGEYIKKFGNVLKTAGIDKDITVECVFDDFEKEAAESFAFVKEAVL